MLQIGIRAWLCSLFIIHGTIDIAKCIGHACMSVSCVALTLLFHVVVALRHNDHGSSKVIIRKLMLILWNTLS